MSYKVELVRHIYRDCETYELGAWASKKLKIPFPPFEGLKVTTQGDDLTVVAVNYDADTNLISCLTECVNHEDYNHAIQVYKEFGWNIREVTAGNFATGNTAQHIRDIF